MFRQKRGGRFETGGADRNSGELFKRLRAQAAVVWEQQTGNPLWNELQAGKN
jgi:hypothetical protein